MRRYRFTSRFEKSLAGLPDEAAALFEKKLSLFLEDTAHPSFRTKKIQGVRNPEIWEASLTMDYRFTFQMEKDGVIVFRNIGKHSILEKKKY
ncbi:MAG: hypothetical protein Q8J64_07000 [Thermodesulfovibrionales bacterium]|nr:hypothetical protein [Thermodesulfovibrionales bacterium]